MILIVGLISLYVNGNVNNLKYKKMGVIVKPKNLNERQIKRVDRIAESNPERARKVSDRISDRRNARGAENPQLAKPLMKKGGKAKAEKGGAFGMLSVKAGIDKNPNPTQADRIAGAKGMAKSGKKLAKQAAIAIAMKKAGKSPKMKSGGTVSMQLGSYKGVIGKNTKGKATKAVGLTKAKMGKSMGKCKYGC
jgi:hypothetical protein